jgi:hypothetical protein
MGSPNNQPIYSRSGSTSNNSALAMNQLVTLAAADYTGVNANNTLVFTSDPTNGSFVQRLRFKAGGTNVASVARIYINNGGVNTSAANNSLYGEVTLPATTAIATASTVDIDYSMNFALDPGFRIYFGLGTAVAGGWNCIAIGGRY